MNVLTHTLWDPKDGVQGAIYTSSNDHWKTLNRTQLRFTVSNATCWLLKCKLKLREVDEEDYISFSSKAKLRDVLNVIHDSVDMHGFVFCGIECDENETKRGGVPVYKIKCLDKVEW